MHKILGEHNEVCCKLIVDKNQHGLGILAKWYCGKPAEYTDGSLFFCRHHARMGRFVAREGDIGEIKARFDTEAELRANIHLYPTCRMQKISRSNRKDLV